MSERAILRCRSPGSRVGAKQNCRLNRLNNDSSTQQSCSRRATVAAALSGELPSLLDQARDLVVAERSLGSVRHA